MHNILDYFKRNSLLIILFIVGILIAISSILVKQSILRVIPLFISLLVSFLQSKLNRFSHLIGSINSIIYAIVYLSFKLYGTTIQALFISFPIQLITFILWSKKPYKNSTILKKMSTKMRIIAVSCSAIICIVSYFILSKLGSAQPIFESFSFPLSIIIPVLTTFSFIEYTVFMIPNVICTMLMYSNMIIHGELIQIPFLIYNIYSLICAISATHQAKILFKQQNADKKGASM